MPEGRTRRSLAYYSLIGGLIALALDCLAWTAWFLTCQAMLRHLPHPARTSSDLNLMLAQVRAQHHALLLLPRALWTIVFVAECAIAFWVGRRAAPAWYWGLSPVAAKLVRMVALLAVYVVAGPFGPGHTLRNNLNLAQHRVGAIAISLTAAGVLALAAFIGSRTSPKTERKGAESFGGGD
jgi:hypothetical protein